MGSTAEQTFKMSSFAADLCLADNQFLKMAYFGDLLGDRPNLEFWFDSPDIGSIIVLSCACVLLTIGCFVGGWYTLALQHLKHYKQIPNYFMAPVYAWVYCWIITVCLEAISTLYISRLTPLLYSWHSLVEMVMIVLCLTCPHGLVYPSLFMSVVMAQCVVTLCLGNVFFQFGMSLLIGSIVEVMFISSLAVFIKKNSAAKWRFLLAAAILHFFTKPILLVGCSDTIPYKISRWIGLLIPSISVVLASLVSASQWRDINGDVKSGPGHCCCKKAPEGEPVAYPKFLLAVEELPNFMVSMHV